MILQTIVELCITIFLLAYIAYVLYSNYSSYGSGAEEQNVYRADVDVGNDVRAGSGGLIQVEVRKKQVPTPTPSISEISTYDELDAAEGGGSDGIGLGVDADPDGTGATYGAAGPARRRPVRAFVPSPQATKQLTLASARRGERICAEICKRLLPDEEVYYNYRDPQLANPETSRALELDIFYPGRSLAIEFNGEQHYDETGFGCPMSQMARDHIKIGLAHSYGITLVTIPYTFINNEALIEATIRGAIEGRNARRRRSAGGPTAAAVVKPVASAPPRTAHDIYQAVAGRRPRAFPSDLDVDW